jgi:hypothetical protein
MRSFVICIHYLYIYAYYKYDKIKEGDVDGTCSTDGRDGRCKQNLSLKACSLGRWVVKKWMWEDVLVSAGVGWVATVGFCEKVLEFRLGELLFSLLIEPSGM